MTNKAKTVYLGLGSNMGDREEFITQALYMLENNDKLIVTQKSSLYETEPEGETEQPLFLNAAVEITTSLSPNELIALTNDIEDILGRDREALWGPRNIDIDILLYGEEIINEDDLQIPHPLMHERAFVLAPLAQIAPDVVHPALDLTIAELYAECGKEYQETYDDKELKGEFKRLKEDYHGESRMRDD